MVQKVGCPFVKHTTDIETEYAWTRCREQFGVNGETVYMTIESMNAFIQEAAILSLGLSQRQWYHNAFS